MIREPRNYESLIDTFNKAYKRNKKARLLLAGSINKEVDIKDKVKKYGVQDLEKLYE